MSDKNESASYERFIKLMLGSCAVRALSEHGSDTERAVAGRYKDDDIRDFDLGITMKDGRHINVTWDGEGEPFEVYSMLDADGADDGEMSCNEKACMLFNQLCIMLFSAMEIKGGEKAKKFGEMTPADIREISIEAEFNNGETVGYSLPNYANNYDSPEDEDCTDEDDDMQDECCGPCEGILSAVAVQNPIDMVDKIISNPPATVVYWKNGEKTVVRCSEDDEYNLEQGVALCFLKYAFGNNGRFNELFHALERKTGVVYSAK